VQEYPILTGRVFYNPWTEKVYQYPTFKQNYVWTASPHEGQKTDESIGFNSIEGTNINADMGAVFNVKPGQTPPLFITYKQDIETLTAGIIRNELRDAVNREAGRMKVMDIIGPGKGALLDAVKADLNRGPLGQYVYFETVSFVHNPRPDAAVQAAINNVITAKNNAEAAAANAQAAINKARGDSASVVIANTGDAEGNRRLQASLSDEIIRYTLANHWDGHMPQVTSGSGSPSVLFSPNKN
jgi:regulator of protease activity HflC (stomatin/prohibitin superfamily)